MGANKDSMKISASNVDYVRFKDEDFVALIQNNPNATLTIYGRTNLNYFNGKYSVQCFIDDYELNIPSGKYDF